MPAARRRRAKSPAEATPFDWLLLAAITLIGGSSFSMIRGAVATMEPAAIAVGRLWIGAGLLYILMRIKGRRFPSLIVPTQNGPRIHRVWLSMIAVGAVGNTVAFFIFPWAQQYVDSGLAGIYMAFMPIWTLALAYIFANETLSPRKIAGFVLGFAGVVILMGPEMIGGVAETNLVAQGGLLIATFLYAASAVLARRAPPVRPRVFAAGYMLCAALIATPALLFFELHPDRWTLASMINVVGLGLFPTGLAGVLIIILIKRTGASFMALANYVTPLCAVVLGAVIYHERLELQAFIALAIIFAGVGISQQRPKRKILDLDPSAEICDGLAAELNPVAQKAATDAAAPR